MWARALPRFGRTIPKRRDNSFTPDLRSGMHFRNLSLDSGMGMSHSHSARPVREPPEVKLVVFL
jgi:hypothetical protein